MIFLSGETERSRFLRQTSLKTRKVKPCTFRFNFDLLFLDCDISKNLIYHNVGFAWIAKTKLFEMDFKCSFSMIDCVLSAFSFKIRLVLISASAIVNHDATPSLTPSFIPARVIGFRVQQLCKKKIRYCWHSFFYLYDSFPD